MRPHAARPHSPQGRCPGADSMPLIGVDLRLLRTWGVPTGPRLLRRRVRSSL